jgi:uncharacterized membrane protein
VDSLPELLGHLHPVVLHFPIALLCVGAGLEVMRIWRESPFAARAGAWLFGVGAVLAVVAVTTGWQLAASEKVRSDERATLELHRWFSVATAAVACVAWLASHRWREMATPRQAWVRRLCVLATLMLVTAAGHLGAVLVWGKDWFSFGST